MRQEHSTEIKLIHIIKCTSVLNQRLIEPDLQKNERNNNFREGNSVAEWILVKRQNAVLHRDNRRGQSGV